MISAYSLQSTINSILCCTEAWYFVFQPFLSTRFLILHLWHPEEPRLETFPRDAWAPLFRQPWCARPENPCELALRRGCWCHRSDNIVSTVGRQPTIFKLKTHKMMTWRCSWLICGGVTPLSYLLHWFVNSWFIRLCEYFFSLGTPWM